MTLMTSFTKFLTPELIHELCNLPSDWLDWLISTNHRTDDEFVQNIFKFLIAFLAENRDNFNKLRFLIADKLKVS